MLKRVLKKLVSPLTWIWDRPWPYWFACVRRWPRDVKHGVGNLIRWFPIIWDDRDWDWAFLNRMLIFKLEGMEKCIRNGMAQDGSERADEILEAIIHLDALEDGDECPPRKDGRPLTIEDYQAWEKEVQNHQTRAFYIIGTNMRGWWD